VINTSIWSNSIATRSAAGSRTVSTWDRVNLRRPWRNSYGTDFYGAGRDEDFATLPGTGRLLRALLVWQELGDRTGLPGHIAPGRPDPAFTAGTEQGHWYSHFHARAIALRGLLAYGRVTMNQRIVEFVRRAYEFTLTQGIPRIGWVNCFPGAFNQMEGCALGDLVGLGICLSDLGAGDYWDDVDAVVRNHRVEQQLTRADELERIAAHFRDPQAAPPATAAGQVCFDHVIARSLGVFTGTSLPNAIPHPWVMHCCTGNATQGLYYAWEGALREMGDQAVVNLWLNHDGRLVDVDSCLPYEGKLVIRNKAARRVAVRVPSWVRMASTCEFRGSTLVDIAPHDDAADSYPLYRRAHLRTDQTPYRTVQRFVAARIVRGW
jgi:hypothetical protein